MTNIKKEIAKFFAGAMAWHALTHLAFEFSDVLPLTIFGITMTPGMNKAGIIVWSAVAAIVAYYAWGKGKSR